jgi:Rad52/22 family double-strand break repair protein
MGFSAKQTRALRRGLNSRKVRTRFQNGRELSYIEGWHAIAEANRIFGFDAWDRETVESRCVMAREIRGTFSAVYTAKVRVTVRAGGETIVREGHGTGEARGSTSGEVHDTAYKAAETDATKRGLATFGNPFGLALYLAGRGRSGQRPFAGDFPDASRPSTSADPFATCGTIRLAHRTVGVTPAVSNLAPPTPLEQSPGRAKKVQPTNSQERMDLTQTSNPAGQVQHSNSGPLQADTTPVIGNSEILSERHDDSDVGLGTLRRCRDKNHLRFVASQPCLFCGRQPSDPHHVRFAQPRALGRKVSDEFTVPLCRGHHRQLHQSGNEAAWWSDMEVDPLPIAHGLWEESRAKRDPA